MSHPKSLVTESDMDRLVRHANLRRLYEQRYGLLWEERISHATFMRIVQEYDEEFGLERSPTRKEHVPCAEMR